MLIAAMIANIIALAACNDPRPARTFADEDECEDAGMSDAFCDTLFPEVEDFFETKKKKTKLASKPSKSKLSYVSRARVYSKK
jgi:hypothetical protein